MENLLTCSICLETFNDPRTLPCLHSFCLACLEKFVKDRRVRDKRDDKVVEEFNCPICRSVFRLKINEEVVNMSSNHFIRSSLGILSIQRQAKTKTARCATSQCHKPATGRCITCELFLCNACTKFHENWPSFKDHTVLLLSELATCTFENQAKMGVERKHRCEKHKNKTLKFFCETCEVLICRYCMDFVHIKQGHSCVLAEDVAEKKKQALETSYQTQVGNLNEGTKALQVVSSVKQHLEESITMAKNKVSQHKQEILKQFTNVLDQKVEDVIMELDLEYWKNIQSLDKQADTLNSYLKKLKVSVDLTKNLLDNGCREDIISLQKMIEENMEKLKGERLKSLTGVHGGKIEVKIKPLKAECITAAFGDGLAEVGKT